MARASNVPNGTSRTGTNYALELLRPPSLVRDCSVSSMGAEGVKKAKASSNSPKVVIGKQLANKKSKSSALKSKHSFKEDAWYPKAWAKLSISANGPAYHAERADELTQI